MGSEFHHSCGRWRLSQDRCELAQIGVLAFAASILMGVSSARALVTVDLLDSTTREAMKMIPLPASPIDTIDLNLTVSLTNVYSPDIWYFKAFFWFDSWQEAQATVTSVQSLRSGTTLSAWPTWVHPILAPDSPDVDYLFWGSPLGYRETSDVLALSLELTGLDTPGAYAVKMVPLYFLDVANYPEPARTRPFTIHLNPRANFIALYYPGLVLQTDLCIMGVRQLSPVG